MLNYNVEGGAQVVSHILSLIDDPEVGLSEVADVVMEDPVMTAKILSIANQDWFGLSKQISNPHVAVSLVGPEVVRSVAMLYMVEGSGCPIHLRTLSKMTGDAAARNAASYSVRVPVAQCAGLVLYLGDIMIYQQDRPNYERLDKMGLLDRTRKEIELYGAPRDVLTSELLSHWNFPTEVIQGVRERFDPDTGSPLARLLHYAEQIVGERINDGDAIKIAISS
jgi:HD-like signal output (HDOD) protein